MPVFDFKCSSCSGVFEEVFLCGDPVEDTLPCRFCDESAGRVVIAAFRVGGLEGHQLDDLERQMFTPKQRAAGHRLRQSDNPVLRDRGNELRFRSGRDLERYEESKGWKRVESGTAEYKRNISNLLDDQSDIRNIREREGLEAATEHINKTDIKAKTGWGESQYSRWKNLTDEASITPPTEV